MLEAKKLSKIKIISLFFGLSFFLILNLSYLKFESSSDLEIGFVTDIHAGDQTERDDGTDPKNIIFPDHFEKNFRNALLGMRRVDLIFTLGDNLNRPSRKNAKKLKEISRSYPIYWTKGNHDKLSHFQEILSEERYYYLDKKDWRIIVLDNSDVAPNYHKNHEEHGRGYIDEVQLDWLKEALKTDRKIIVTMHVPMISRSKLGEVRGDQKYLEDLFLKNGNVKHIFSGHFHVYDEHIEKSGITHHLIPSLSLKGKEGYYYKVRL